MSGQLTLEPSTTVPWHQRPAALVTVATARLMAHLSPRRLRQVLELASHGARPADLPQALQARNAVVSVSVAIAGPRCLERSIATALLCRLGGTWPQWCTGVTTQPFTAHAWIVVDGNPVGEDPDAITDFHLVMSVPAR
ncbi:lasso peptide biosynthesis B2 protein [Streptomyces sp. NBC_00868]|uniref:lasso peptide biosynthesis B2 protein n=1 Tax=unclassified Streptomyces TaxID=2593676 RepID=UPI00324ED8B2|nr:lasso peptide biosynthesis B2 protein [Streptomyces sp. NBC_00868]